MVFDCIECGEHEIWYHETLLDVCRDCYHNLKLGPPEDFPKNPTQFTGPLTIDPSKKKEQPKEKDFCFKDEEGEESEKKKCNFFDFTKN